VALGLDEGMRIRDPPGLHSGHHHGRRLRHWLGHDRRGLRLARDHGMAAVRHHGIWVVWETIRGHHREGSVVPAKAWATGTLVCCGALLLGREAMAERCRGTRSGRALCCDGQYHSELMPPRWVERKGERGRVGQRKRPREGLRRAAEGAVAAVRLGLSTVEI
jgi:hypothetical protein